jgi:hypothetical protein
MTSITSYLKRIRLLTSLDPERDWIILLITSIIVLTGIVVWNAWTFDTVVNGGAIGSAATSTPPLFDQISLETIHTIFDERASEEKKYVSGAYRYVDPSL